MERAIGRFVVLFLALCAEPAWSRDAGTEKTKSDPFEHHRKVAMTANRETRAYAVLHCDELTRLAGAWEQTKPRTSSLVEYLRVHDAGFKDVVTRWKQRYNDDKILSVLVWAQSQAILMRTFGGVTTAEDAVRKFQTHRSEFEALRVMLNEDRAKGLRSVGMEKTNPADLDEVGISKERLAQYREQMRAIEISFLSAVPGAGFNCGGHYMVWLDSPPEMAADGSVRMVQNFDAEINHQIQSDAADADRAKQLQTHTRFFKKIDEHWYLDSGYNEPGAAASPTGAGKVRK